jgi:hypothetical protein
VDPYLNKGLNEFQRLILFSQFLTIFGGIMLQLVESVDKLLEIEESPSKRQERNIVAALIVAVNVVAIGIYPIYRMITVTIGFKGGVLLSRLYFSLRDTVQNLRGTVQNLVGGKESRSQAKVQGKSKNLIEAIEARKLGYPPRFRSPKARIPEPISHSNHGGAPVPRPALLEPVYMSTREMMSAAGPPSESLSTAIGAKYSGLAPTPPIRYSKISAEMVYKMGREEPFRV